MTQQEQEQERRDAELAAKVDHESRRGVESAAEVDEVRQVREVLTTIAVEEAVASVELRIADLEGEVERAHSHAEEADRSRRGELEVMRARIEDTLALVRTATEEHQQAWSQLERRLTEVVGEVDASTGRLLEGLRDELAPRVHRAALQAEEVEARLTGEVDAVRAEVLEALRSAREESSAAIAAVQERAGGLSEALTQQLETLRVELEGAVGELRAADNLQGQQVEQAVTDLRAELATSIEPYLRAAAQREEQLKAAIDDLRRRLQDAAAARASAAERERTAREEGTSKLRSRLEDLASRIEQVDTRSVGQTSRHLAELGQLHRTVEEVGGRVEVLSQRVATAIDGVAGQLATRLSSLTAEVAALHEAGVRQEERLATVEGLKRRVAELESSPQGQARGPGEQPAAADATAGPGGQPAVGGMTDGLTELGGELAVLAGRLDAVESHLSDAVESHLSDDVRLDALAQGQAALTHQLRELAAGVEQLTGRVADAERVAQAAGRAIVSAVRRGRQDAAQQPLPMTPGFPSP